jgi:hypothetical protein
MTDLLLQISIAVGIIGNIVGISIGVFIIGRYFLIIEKRFKQIEDKIGVVNKFGVKVKKVKNKKAHKEVL